MGQPPSHTPQPNLSTRKKEKNRRISKSHPSPGSRSGVKHCFATRMATRLDANASVCKILPHVRFSTSSHTDVCSPFPIRLLSLGPRIGATGQQRSAHADEKSRCSSQRVRIDRRFVRLLCRRGRCPPVCKGRRCCRRSSQDRADRYGPRLQELQEIRQPSRGAERRSDEIGRAL